MSARHMSGAVPVMSQSDSSISARTEGQTSGARRKTPRPYDPVVTSNVDVSRASERERSLAFRTTTVTTFTWPP